MDVRRAAVLLGGDVNGRNTVLAPGPGHSPQDRSMSVLLEPSAPEGFVVNSFAGDDWLVCRDHVRAMVGLSAGPHMHVARRPRPRAPARQ